ncbi:hypothetical protein THASP1DRAFT_8432, partial [Thamnocephalis sphaerospora]
DYLPRKCQHCAQAFCEEHWRPEVHGCPAAQQTSVDVRVPACPLCGQPVSVARGEDPNLKVDLHIRRGCAKSAARAAPANVCKERGCQAKLLMPMRCSDCQGSFCVKHRHPGDHQC